MKGKTATTGLLAMGIVIALATLGLVYGNWTQTLNIGGTVTTSGLNAEFLLDAGSPTDADGTAGDPLPKNVGDCTAVLVPTTDPVTGEPKDKGVTITIDNAYPNYWCNISGAIKNTGQMPITVVAKVPTMEVQNANGAWKAFDPATIGLKVNDLPCGTASKQLMPGVGGDGDELACKILISFPPENKDGSGESLLPEKASFRFSWDINICQFDKAC